MINRHAFALLQLLLVAALSLWSCRVGATRLEMPVGKILLTPHAYLEIRTFKAANWQRAQATLFRDGKVVWISPFLAGEFRLGRYARLGPEKAEYAERRDADGDGKLDWIYIANIESTLGSIKERANVGTLDLTQSTPKDDESGQDICGFVSAIIVKGDLSGAYAIEHGSAPNPYGHSSLSVLGAERTRAVIANQQPSDTFWATAGTPASVWSTLRDIRIKRSCSMAKIQGKLWIPEKDWPPVNVRFQPFSLDWRPYLPGVLDMYRRAQTIYQEWARELPKDERYKALAVFRFTSFFATFPFDEVDPENKVPEYTALMNDYAYYQLVDIQTNLPEQRRALESLHKVRDVADSEKAAKEYIVNSSLDKLRENVIPLLEHVIERDPKRVVAYLNLADAQWELPELQATARSTYRRYIDVLKRTNPKARPDKNALQRASTAP